MTQADEEEAISTHLLRAKESSTDAISTDSGIDVHQVRLTSATSIDSSDFRSSLDADVTSQASTNSLTSQQTN